MYNTKDIEINQLEVSKINPRFIQVALDEKTAISELIRLEPKKMLNLLHNINNGVLPIPFYLVKQNSKLILMDGNRRLTAMKILQDPTLIPNTKENEKIIDFCNNSSFKAPKTMPCIVFNEYSDSLFDVLENLHVSDESKADWTPLAQYRMSSRMGGNKYSWMKTLLFYYEKDVIVDKITGGNADKYNRMFTALKASGIEIGNNGELNTENAREKLDCFYKLFKDKTLDTRSSKEDYQDYVDKIFRKNEIITIEKKNLDLFLIKDKYYEGQCIDILTLIKAKDINSSKSIDIDYNLLSLTYKNPLGTIVENLDTQMLGTWELNYSYKDNYGKLTMEILPKLEPKIIFVNDIGVLKKGSSRNLKSFIEYASNSYGDNVKDKVKVKAMPNQMIYLQGDTFSGENPLGIYSVQYYFKDIDQTNISEVFTIKVIDEIDLEPFKALSLTNLPLLSYGKNITIDIEPTVNKLVNEINKLNFNEFPSVITCSIRSIIEITFDTLLKDEIVDYKKSLDDKLKEIIDKLLIEIKANGFIDKNDKNFYSYDKETNFLNEINISNLNALLNQGAHSSTQVINQNNIEECIRKEISHLLALISRWRQRSLNEV